MTHVLGLLCYIESRGVQLRAADSGICFRAPASVLTDSLKELVKVNKPELVKMLEARRKFGYREAALFPLIGHSVVTTHGGGELLSVSLEYCRVQLHRTGAVTLYPPRDLISLAVSEFGEAVAA